MSHALVDVIEEIHVVETGDVIVELVEVGIQGPRGIPGTGGGSSSLPGFKVFFVTIAGAQTIPLDQAPLANTLRFFINGLEQGDIDYTLTGQTVTIPGSLGLEPDEILDFSYWY